MKPRRPARQALRLCDALISELAIPVPFDPGQLALRLERLTGRATVITPAELNADSPSGAWIRTSGADYLFYAKRTSLFHQAHIMLSLAGRMLLAGPEASADQRLVPDVDSQLIRLMLGRDAVTTTASPDAEDFAILAADRADLTAIPVVLAWRARRQLSPLQAAMREAVPPVSAGLAGHDLPGVRHRLHQQVAEIRDAVLALQPFRDHAVALAAERDARAAGLDGDELAAAVEGAALSAAASASRTGRPPAPAAGADGLEVTTPASLRGEAGWLVKVARAFSEGASAFPRGD